ncbi:cellulose-binding domain-containing protein [Catellatospora tritici]|uniref:cellulose-binding domain-containing protein n=1 Tax=Catellatospora tritici TaxID=2851566 RepID=UPI0020C43E2A|nr:cellulose-binding domain-containing protein [Catellatospora tritici]
MSPISRRLVASLVAAAAGLATVAWGLFVPTAQAAAAGCQVTYRVSSQWGGGFTADVALTNLGDPVTAWTLKWTFPAASQAVSQGWNATFSQSGAQVTAANLGYNGSLGTGAGTSIGFNGAWTTANPVPTSFTLNGVTCTGTTTPASPSPSRTASPSPSPSRSASPSPSPSRSASPSPSTSPSSSGWNPPANLVQPLNEVWAHYESTYNQLYTFRNYGWDQVMAGGGQINYCVRWDSSAHVTATQRDQIHAALARQFKKWMDVMAGHNGWPYANVPVKVVGWAVRDRAALEWTDSSVDIYVNNIRENAPQCGEPCGRFFHQDGNYSGCAGGASHHYDMSLWLTAGMTGGAGGDWGQRIGSEYYTSNLNTDNIHILLHEMGHSFGLDDFYDWTPTGQCCFIMNAGSATSITEFDKWMLRDWWRHLKSRWGY